MLIVITILLFLILLALAPYEVVEGLKVLGALAAWGVVLALVGFGLLAAVVG